MKTSINNRKENVAEFQSWIEASGLSIYSTKGRKEIIERYCFESITKAYPLRDPTTKRFLDRVKFKKQAAMRALQLVCKNAKVPNTIGYVYAITNPAFPGWVKIGASVDAETRLNQYQTYSPHRDYKLEGYVMCLDYISLENRVLRKFPNRNGEWVQADVASVLQIIKTEEQID
ncbi:hypothetical protein SB_095 [Salmonella phage vB_SenS_SB9]|uniref:Bacteriophage T5 Orf172 DNA-binding domain-containing protein n=1 Tax=Salmonella phage vB_SenS_SB9 TaxID=2588125 RepID=A0A514A245_9CAUD|nr:hypothetical protein SB_095 [Salmonella phage vB_SenS_SB9]